MKKYFFLLLFIVSFLTVSAQNYFRIDGIQYPSTSAWRFYNKDYNADLIITKKNDGTGFLVIGVSAGNSLSQALLSTYSVGGTLYIYLSDGTTIKCIDRKRYGTIDDFITNYYNLTKDEITKLKTHNITGIMFSLGHYYHYMGFETVHSYTAPYYSNTKNEVLLLFK